MAAPSSSASGLQMQAELQMLLNGPAGHSPSGAIPNFQSPPNLNAVFITTVTLCAALTSMAVIVRLYTKVLILRSIAFEDYIIVTALIGQLSFIGTSSVILRSGGGIHMWDLRLKDFFNVLYWLNISSPIYGIVVFLIKLSILLQYLRIFVPSRRGNMGLYIAIHGVIWSIFIFYLVVTVFEIALCRPREKIWNLLYQGGHCFNTNAPAMASGIFNIVSDFAILVIPIAPIWNLQMPFRRKMMIAAVFATGFSACATSILRTVYTWKIVQTPDVSYNILRMGLWTAAEMTTGILVSCLPVMPRFFQHFGLKIHTRWLHRSDKKSHVGQHPDLKFIKRLPVHLWYGRSDNIYSDRTGDSETLKDEYRSDIKREAKHSTFGEPNDELREGAMTELPSIHQAQDSEIWRGDLEAGINAIDNEITRTQSEESIRSPRLG